MQENYFSSFGITGKASVLSQANKRAKFLKVPLLVYDFTNNPGAMYKAVKTEDFRNNKARSEQGEIVICMIYPETIKSEYLVRRTSFSTYKAKEEARRRRRFLDSLADIREIERYNRQFKKVRL